MCSVVTNATRRTVYYWVLVRIIWSNPRYASSDGDDYRVEDESHKGSSESPSSQLKVCRPQFWFSLLYNSNLLLLIIIINITY